MADGTRRVSITAPIDERASVTLLYDVPADLPVRRDDIIRWAEKHAGEVVIVRIEERDDVDLGMGIQHYDDENGWDEVTA